MTETIIRGQRIVLRSYRASDAEPMLRLNHETNIQRLTGTHTIFTLEQIQRYIGLYHDPDVTDRAGFIIAVPESLEPLGEVVINNIDLDNRSGNIRIVLLSEGSTGQGYGSEAMRLMVDYGFRILGLHRIELGVYAFNPRAIHVYEKIGFKREGVLRDSLFFDDEFHDQIIMSILEHEWGGS